VVRGCARTALDVFFLRLAPADIAFVKFIFESYEGVAVVRTLDRREAVIAVLVSADFIDVARGILRSLRETVAMSEVTPPAGVSEDWLLRFVGGGLDGRDSRGEGVGSRGSALLSEEIGDADTDAVEEQ